MINVDTLVPFLIEIGLTANEFIILHLKHHNKVGLLKGYKKKFSKNKENILTVSSKKKIIELGYLEHDDTREGEYYFLTDKFKALYMDKNMFFEAYELWDLYPGFTTIKGGNAPLMNTNKTAWLGKYYDAIEGLKGEHEQVMLDTQYGIEHGMIKVKIIDYVESQAWTKIRAIRLGEIGKAGTAPVQIDTGHEF